MCLFQIITREILDFQSTIFQKYFPKRGHILKHQRALKLIRNLYSFCLPISKIFDKNFRNITKPLYCYLLCTSENIISKQTLKQQSNVHWWLLEHIQHPSWSLWVWGRLRWSEWASWSVYPWFLCGCTWQQQQQVIKNWIFYWVTHM